MNGYYWSILLSYLTTGLLGDLVMIAFTAVLIVRWKRHPYGTLLASGSCLLNLLSTLFFYVTFIPPGLREIFHSGSGLAKAVGWATSLVSLCALAMLVGAVLLAQNEAESTKPG